MDRNKAKEQEGIGKTDDSLRIESQKKRPIPVKNNQAKSPKPSAQIVQLSSIPTSPKTNQ